MQCGMYLEHTIQRTFDLFLVWERDQTTLDWVSGLGTRPDHPRLGQWSGNETRPP